MIEINNIYPCNWNICIAIEKSKDPCKIVKENKIIVEQGSGNFA